MDTEQSSQELNTTIETKLQPFVRQVVESFGLAGLAIGIVKSGELVYSQGFGVRNLDTGEPVTPRSLFHMASVSKPFVATAIVQLVEQEKIALDAPILTYLPYFRLVVLANSNTAPIGGLTDAALDVLLGVEPQAPKPSIAVLIPHWRLKARKRRSSSIRTCW